jgi:hypothetical protein
MCECVHACVHVFEYARVSVIECLNVCVFAFFLPGSSGELTQLWSWNRLRQLSLDFSEGTGPVSNAFHKEAGGAGGPWADLQSLAWKYSVLLHTQMHLQAGWFIPPCSQLLAFCNNSTIIK